MTKGFADISVIVPAYQAEQTIQGALASVAAQTLKPREVIVVDDGSTDATAARAEAFRSSMPGIDLVVERQSQQGAGAARNTAVALSRQPILAFLDSDDDWAPAHLEVSLARLLDGNHVLTAHNEMLVEGGRERINDSVARLKERRDPVVAIYCKGCISTSTVLARRDAVIGIGGFDPSLANGQDVDMWLAVVNPPGASFEIFEDVLSRYFIREGSINSKVRRRYRFFVQIALRWAGEMTRRPGTGLGPLWFRMTAIHYEAAKSFIAGGSYGALLAICLNYPIQMVRISWRGLMKTAAARGHYLPDLPRS